MTTRVLIVDDHPAVREGLALRLSSQPDLEACGEAADVPEALKLFDAARPDVVVVDIQLKTTNGLDLVKRIASRDESARILVWSMYPDKVYARRALKAGALGYINKEHTTDRLIEAIRCVACGKVYLCEEIASALLSQAVGRAKTPQDSPLESLSDRELEVFRLIGDGLSTSQIARRLHLSTHTVDTHRQRIKEKLNLATASELTRAAIRWVVEGEMGE
jgi:DNA-binding NarL/FixJ family response regulator